MAAGVTAAALFALNPNMLYLQSIPMTEIEAFACLSALLYFTVRFRDTQGWGSVAGAGVAALAGTLTRYEGWFLLPFVAVYFLVAAKRQRVAVAVLFCALASLGPLFWLFHNWWLNGDPLDFYRGPWSARDSGQSRLSREARLEPRAVLLSHRGRPVRRPLLPWIALAGVVAALWPRAFWPLLLLLLPGAFYVWSMHPRTARRSSFRC